MRISNNTTSLVRYYSATIQFTLFSIWPRIAQTN
jgi:hypothetical protein